MAESHAIGIASVTEALHGADFPKSKQELITQYGNRQIEFHMGHKEALRDVLEKTPEENFGSMADVVHAVHESYTR